MNNTTNAPERLSCIRDVRLWESLAPLHPFLEFFDGSSWTKSGIITGTCSRALVGRYRVNKHNELALPATLGTAQQRSSGLSNED